jgi:hypothetical protein
MNTLKVCLLVAACVYTHTAAQAQTNPMPPRSATAIAPTRVTNEATSDTGTLIRKDMRWNSKIPLNKTYGELTPEQKEELRAMYESMPADEEPPFPAEGMKPIFNAIKQAQAKLLAKGVLNLAVTVGPDGKPKNVVDLGSTKNPEMTEFAASVLMMTTYKPALCRGKPCESQFPLSLKLGGR